MQFQGLDSSLCVDNEPSNDVTALKKVAKKILSSFKSPKFLTPITSTITKNLRLTKALVFPVSFMPKSHEFK